MTRNFEKSEFACKCGCGSVSPSPTVVLVAQMVRDHFGERVTVNSATRCSGHNANVGGTTDSQHMIKADGYSHAVDIVVENVKPDAVYTFLNGLFPHSLGIGLYDEFTHIDDRMDRAYRW